MRHIILTLLLLLALPACDGFKLQGSKTFAFANAAVAVSEVEGPRTVTVTMSVSGFQVAEEGGGVKLALVGGVELLDLEGRPVNPPLPPEVRHQKVEQQLDSAPQSATFTLSFPAPTEAGEYVLLLKATDALSGAEIRQRQKLVIAGTSS